MFLGDHIRVLREESGLSQEDLGLLAGISTRSVSRIELRQVTPHASTLRRIAVALGESPDFFWLYIQVRPKPKLRTREAVFA